MVESTGKAIQKLSNQRVTNLKLNQEGEKKTFLMVFEE